MIRLIKYQNKGQLEGVAGKWYLRVKNGEQIDVDGLASHMEAHNSPFSKGVIKGILTDAVTCIKELLLDGKTVKLADLALFSLGIHCKGADTPENCLPSNIVGYRFNARGTGLLAPKRLAAEIRVREMDAYDAPVSKKA